ncbi:hypothetical protein NC651_027399 [Populus alba x Populus x berolinensis]|nr:hypothetical protein NC651_027399 [Populus alba x Populus x berolinensis]
MAHLASLNVVTETLPATAKITNVQKAQKRMKITGFVGVSLAEDNWWTRDIPLPVPSVENGELCFLHAAQLKA